MHSKTWKTNSSVMSFCWYQTCTRRFRIPTQFDSIQLIWIQLNFGNKWIDKELNPVWVKWIIVNHESEKGRIRTCLAGIRRNSADIRVHFYLILLSLPWYYALAALLFRWYMSKLVGPSILSIHFCQYYLLAVESLISSSVNLLKYKAELKQSLTQ